MSGLRNLGNTCYMNSAIQLLMNMEIFKSIVYKYKNSHESINTLYRFIEHYKENPIANPCDVKKLVGNRKCMFGGFGQQDSHEFLIFLFDIIDEIIKDKGDDLYKNLGLVFNIGYKCKITNCLYESTHKERELFLNLDMSDSLDTSYRNYKQIEKLVDDNLYFCEKCNKKRPGRKQIITEVWPHNLIIVLKRFNNNMIKNNNSIEIPNEWRHGYILKGGIVHSGSLNGGHYVYFGNRNNSWYLYNDSSVSVLNENEFNNYKKKAYILHYEKI